MINENLFKAVKKGNIAKVEKVLKKERINATTYHGAKSVIFAAEKGYLEILKMLLDNGREIPRESFWSNCYNIGLSSMSKAVRNGRTDIVRLLLMYGACTVEKDLQEVFVKALLSGNLEIMDILLNEGANIHLKDENGYTPLMSVVLFPSENQEATVEWLLKEGVYVNVRRKAWHKDGTTRIWKVRTALSYAEELGKTKIVEILNNAQNYRKKKKK